MLFGILIKMPLTPTFLNLFEIALINNLDSLDCSKRDNWTLEIDFETVEISHIKIIVFVLDFLGE